jgi:hypothetical protein
MKPYLESVLCFSLILCMSGCEELSQKSNQPQEIKKPESSAPIAQSGRFVPIAPYNEGRMPVVGIPWHGFFALDTRTGSLCRTMNKEFPQSEWVNRLPLCIDLFSGKITPVGSEIDKILDQDFGKPK